MKTIAIDVLTVGFTLSLATAAAQALEEDRAVQDIDMSRLTKTLRSSGQVL